MTRIHLGDLKVLKLVGLIDKVVCVQAMVIGIELRHLAHFINAIFLHIPVPGN